MSYAIGYVVHGWDLTDVSRDLGPSAYRDMGPTNPKIRLQSTYSAGGDYPTVFGKCLKRFSECNVTTLDEGRLVPAPTLEETNALLIARNKFLALITEYELSDKTVKYITDTMRAHPTQFIIFGSS